MKVTVTHEEGCNRTIEIVVPAETPDAEYDKILKEFKKNIHIPGFRRGKVPPQVIEKRFKKDIEQEVLSKVIPGTIDDALKQENLHPVEQPSLDDVSYTKGNELTITAAFEVKPEIKLEAYKGLEISIDAKEFKITDERVDESLEDLRKRAANFEVVDEERAAKVGDFAEIDVKGISTDEDAEPFSRNDALVEITEDEKDSGFTSNLVGMKKGEEKEFVTDYPDDFEDAAMAGRSFEYNVTLKEIKVRVLPELDDDFAKDLGQFEDLKALRTEIRNQLEDDADKRRKQEVESKLMDEIVAGNERFDLPAVMVQRQLHHMEQNMRYQMMQQGMNPEQLGFDFSTFAESEKENAEKTVRRMLLLDAIAETEDVKVSPKDIRDEIDRIAQRSGEDAKELRRSMMSDGRFEQIGASLRDQKTVDWLIENNTINEG
jgi:trigger factor